MDAGPEAPDLPDIREDPRWVRCAVYTRQSVRRPDDDPAVTSCAIQRTLCTEFIRSKTWQYWYPIAERFDDEGESGATLERPGLARLLRRIEGGDVHRVIVYRVDRLTRKLADLANLAAFFQRHHVGLTIVYGTIDADAGSLAGLQVNMLATFAEWERDMIRDRIADKRGAIKARGGRSAGRVPFGYRTDRITKQLVLDDEAAIAVRWFFNEAAKGTKTSDLVAKATKKKLAKKKWSSRSVLKLLTNHTYAGRRPDGASGAHKPIIEPELFDRVQALIEGRRTRKPTTRNDGDADEKTVIDMFNPFTLRGLITCGACGKPMATAMTGKRTFKLLKRLRKKPDAVARFYRCRTVGCAGQVPALRVEEIVRAELGRPPEAWSDADKARLETCAKVFPDMWPSNKRLVFHECCESVVWNRRDDALEITLRPYSEFLAERDQRGTSLNAKE